MGFLFSNGPGFQATRANLTGTSNTDWLNASHAGAQGGLDQQQAFLQALSGQGGIGNQSSVFNQMQGTAGQLQAGANGTGPNPVMAQLAETTGANARNTAALMAGARGAGANPGLMAKLIGNQAGQIGQQSAGQAATLGAQQQMAFLQALQQQQGMMGNLAGTQVAQQGNATNALASGALSQEQLQQNAIGGMNNANVADVSQANAANSSIAKENTGGMWKTVGGLLNGAGGALGLAHGGMVPGKSLAACYLRDGGMVPGKAEVEGDSGKNDKQPAMLSPGEVVLPRSAVKDPAKTAAFLNALLGFKLKAA